MPGEEGLICRQILSEYLVESVGILEKIASQTKPPLSVKSLERKREQLRDSSVDLGAVRNELKGMESAFLEHGDVSNWDEDVLALIDVEFVKHYMTDGFPDHCLFFPGSAESENKFSKYCGEVDKILKTHPKKAPLYAREYFGYYALWRAHNFKAPMPLGTASAVEAVHMLLGRYSRGVSEVSPTPSSWSAGSVSALTT